MQVLWREEMSIDGGVVDDDHRHLVKIVNRFLAVNEGQSGVKVRELDYLIGDLTRYTVLHFEREEQIQLAIRFPFFQAHRREHEELRTRLSKIARSHKQIPRAGQRLPAGELTEIGTLLRDWLLNHILQADMLMKPYVEEMHKVSSRLRPFSDYLPHVAATRPRSPLSA